MIDCQATAAAPRGHLLEVGWARVRNTATHLHACLIALPPGEQIPPAVKRITGISEHMMRSAVDGRRAWSELFDQACSLEPQPAPTVIHFAQFEQPFPVLAIELKRLIATACPVAPRPSADRPSRGRDSRLRCGGVMDYRDPIRR